MKFRYFKKFFRHSQHPLPIWWTGAGFLDICSPRKAIKKISWTHSTVRKCWKIIKNIINIFKWIFCRDFKNALTTLWRCENSKRYIGSCLSKFEELENRKNRFLSSQNNNWQWSKNQRKAWKKWTVIQSWRQNWIDIPLWCRFEI